MNEPQNFGSDYNLTIDFPPLNITNLTFLECPKTNLELPPYKTWGIYNWEIWEHGIRIGPVSDTFNNNEKGFLVMFQIFRT